MVENYFNHELSDITFDVELLDEWKVMCEDLGMEDQLTLAKGKSSPIPYPYMNEVMIRVYETLCPDKRDFKLFKSVPIPLEVLKQISFSIKENHFSKIEIWADDKKPDPVVVGFHGYWQEYPYGSNENKKLKGIKFISKEEAKEKGANNPDFVEDGKYLISRFGDELKKFDELKQLAKERLIDNLGGELKKEIAVKSEKLKLLVENATSYFNGNMTLYDVKGNW